MTEITVQELHKPSKIKRVLKWMLLSLLGLVGILVVTVLLIANSQDGSIKVLQWAIYRGMKMKPNSFEPRRPPRVAVRESGQLVRTNVKYGTKYPNSYLDIWHPDANDRVKRPTLIHIHGGGWFAGDKDWGDPFAGGGRETIEPFNSLAKAGFNVVVLNYAKAPEYRYPVQMIQLNDAIKCLIDHSNEYGVDMNNVVLMGGSAGAHMLHNTDSW